MISENSTSVLLSLLNIRGYNDTCDIESPRNKDTTKPYMIHLKAVWAGLVLNLIIMLLSRSAFWIPDQFRSSYFV